MPNWMTTLFNNPALGFGARPLRQITMPGTHDAGCYINRGPHKNFLSRTQSPNQNIYAQLQGGIRYFDIRPCVSGGRLWTYHGPYWGDRIDGAGGIIHQVNAFMTELAPADRELVILNISHFHRFTPANHSALTHLITSVLGDHLVPQTQAAIDLFEDQYQDVLDDGAGNLRPRVAILYDGALDTPQEAWVNAVTLPAGFFKIAPKYAAPNPIRLFDQYSNKRWVTDGVITNYVGMRTNQLDKLRNRGNYNVPGAWGGGAWAANAVGGVASTLHLFSWTLTPQPFSDPLTVAMNDANPVLVDVFNNGAGWAGGAQYNPLADDKVNIIYVDRYESHTHPVHGVCPMGGWANPVALSMHLNMYTAATPLVPAAWLGWGGF